MRALVERIDAEQGRLDVLVNDVWGGERLFEWDTPVWEHDLDNGLQMLRLAIDTHLITSHFALPLLIRRPGGLVVEMTDGTREYNDGELPQLGLLRPRQERRAAARVRAGPRARAARRHGGRAHAGLAALGDDARGDAASREANWREGGQPPLRRHLREPAVRRPRRRRARRRPGRRTAATAARSRRASSRASTASPTSTAPGPTAGATSSRSRTPAARRTPPATAEPVGGL